MRRSGSNRMIGSGFSREQGWGGFGLDGWFRPIADIKHCPDTGAFLAKNHYAGKEKYAKWKVNQHSWAWLLEGRATGAGARQVKVRFVGKPGFLRVLDVIPSIASTAPYPHEHLPVVVDGLPPSRPTFPGEHPTSPNHFPRTTLSAGFQNPLITPSVTLFVLSRADTDQPRLATRCCDCISATLTRSVIDGILARDHAICVEIIH